ncbi:hypothetical protein CEUSTIGMA_g6775.t1 [Chlamydomonas eustigma]|uniref:DNA endonuclease activator Ctp1 C-terminal domain-containing protein n=1 Tax=Chlamydomonas eustigma TaxID=1157962 RepID=A0A250X8D0_9CHLO|nr:hypothetical protein CEUSTIGMA_g6775.t1 [Chlamydomonas eustigma]|eukprot:GAX79334.1 hypothetical protein CEUSTIGMA_g6775.t1 [Chlamydomonas eustigma]
MRGELESREGAISMLCKENEWLKDQLTGAHHDLMLQWTVLKKRVEEDVGNVTAEYEAARMLYEETSCKRHRAMCQQVLNAEQQAVHQKHETHAFCTLLFKVVGEVQRLQHELKKALSEREHILSLPPFSTELPFPGFSDGSAHFNYPLGRGDQADAGILPTWDHQEHKPLSNAETNAPSSILAAQMVNQVLRDSPLTLHPGSGSGCATAQSHSFPGFPKATTGHIYNTTVASTRDSKGNAACEGITPHYQGDTKTYKTRCREHQVLEDPSLGPTEAGPTEALGPTEAGPNSLHASGSFNTKHCDILRPHLHMQQSAGAGRQSALLTATPTLQGIPVRHSKEQSADEQELPGILSGSLSAAVAAKEAHEDGPGPATSLELTEKGQGPATSLELTEKGQGPATSLELTEKGPGPATSLELTEKGQGPATSLELTEKGQGPATSLELTEKGPGPATSLELTEKGQGPATSLELTEKGQALLVPEEHKGQQQYMQQHECQQRQDVQDDAADGPGLRVEGFRVEVDVVPETVFPVNEYDFYYQNDQQQTITFNQDSTRGGHLGDAGIPPCCPDGTRGGRLGDAGIPPCCSDGRQAGGLPEHRSSFLKKYDEDCKAVGSDKLDGWPVTTLDVQHLSRTTNCIPEVQGIMNHGSLPSIPPLAPDLSTSYSLLPSPPSSPPIPPTDLKLPPTAVSFHSPNVINITCSPPVGESRRQSVVDLTQLSPDGFGGGTLGTSYVASEVYPLPMTAAAAAAGGISNDVRQHYNRNGTTTCFTAAHLALMDHMRVGTSVSNVVKQEGVSSAILGSNGLQQGEDACLLLKQHQEATEEAADNFVVAEAAIADLAERKKRRKREQQQGKILQPAMMPIQSSLCSAKLQAAGHTQQRTKPLQATCHNHRNGKLDKINDSSLIIPSDHCNAPATTFRTHQLSNQELQLHSGAHCLVHNVDYDEEANDDKEQLRLNDMERHCSQLPPDAPHLTQLQPGRAPHHNAAALRLALPAAASTWDMPPPQPGPPPQDQLHQQPAHTCTASSLMPPQQPLQPPQPPQMKFKDVVRGQEAREALEGFDCQQCQQFYQAIRSWQQQEQQQLQGGGCPYPAAVPPPACGHLVSSGIMRKSVNSTTRATRALRHHRDQLPAAPAPAPAACGSKRGSSILLPLPQEEATHIRNAAAAAAVDSSAAAAAAAHPASLAGHDIIMQNASRHRYRFALPNTPPGFWDIGFMDSQDSRMGSPAEQPALCAAGQSRAAADNNNDPRQKVRNKVAVTPAGSFSHLAGSPLW